MLRTRMLALVVVALLSACAGAPPQRAASPSANVAVINSPTTSATAVPSSLVAVGTGKDAPTASSVTTATEAAPAPSTQATTATTEQNGGVTPIMAKLSIGGERYAALGDPKAPLTIVEYSDYGCPFCRRYATTTFPAVKQRYIDTGKVFYVFKDFPIVRTHPQAALAAEAAECAGEQGQYWAMHERLFAQADEWDTTADQARASFARYAPALGMNGDALVTCVTQGRYRAEVQANGAEATELGMNGTPSFVINGKLLVGAYPTEDFTRIVDRELAGR